MNGSVNANGSDVTNCHVDYVTDAAFGSSGFAGAGSVPCASVSALTGTNDVAVTADLSGLTAGTTYHTEIVATNAGGTTDGADTLVALPAPPAPTVATGAASGLTQTAATLSGTVNPNGGTVTDCHIDYGTSALYGSSVPCSPSPDSGSSAVTVSGRRA